MLLRDFGDPSPKEMGIKPEETETEAEREFNEYILQMRKELEDLVVQAAQSGQESDLRTAFQKSLEINDAFQQVIGDFNDNLDIETVQKIVDKDVRLLRLPEDRFSLSRLKELAKKAD